jgi:hypothetical protein
MLFPAKAIKLTVSGGVMATQSLRISSALLAALPALFITGTAHAQFEKPRSFQANMIPGISAGNQTYSIKSPVTSDGFMRIYVFTTPWGEFSAIGDAMMRQRQSEIAALVEIEKVTNSDSFNKALVDAGLSPIKFAGNLIVNPIGTLGNTMSGIGSLFGQVGSGAANAGKYESDPMADLTGASRRKRELAIKLGVDPYTDFAPLQQKLTQLSAAAATGGLVVTGALMVIPGVGGLIASNTATGANVADAARDNTPAQLLDLNRGKLLKMGVDPKLAETFLLNRNYTPVDATLIVASLEEIQVPGREVFIARAASVGRRDAAVFMRRQAVLLSDYQNKTQAIAGFVPLGGFPFATTRSGVLGLLPLDALSWTQGTDKAMRDITDSLRRGSPGGKAEMRITGQATPLAKQKMKELGWSLTENTKI